MSSFYSFTEIIPVINAFCNCPLIPVFQGFITFAARFRQMQSMITTRMTKTATPVIIMIYFHNFPDAPLGEFCWLAWFTCGETEGEGNGAGDWFCFLLVSGTAGKAPLLWVIGTELISIVGPPLKGAAARLLDWSNNLRRTELIIFGTFWPNSDSSWPKSDSSEPTWWKVCFESQLRA